MRGWRQEGIGIKREKVEKSKESGVEMQWQLSG